MDIFIYTKFVLSSEFKSDSNALIFSLIERELSELCEFYKLYPKMVIFHAAPSVLQMAVNVKQNSSYNYCFVHQNWFGLDVVQFYKFYLTLLLDAKLNVKFGLYLWF